MAKNKIQRYYRSVVAHHGGVAEADVVEELGGKKKVSVEERSIV